ncbi:MAG: hypothetical protein KAW12_07290 [Candidatus Aminicenantes bacterium]|nr:hypothetical protein [Candidatus Aminicenantes bacterium]
MKDEAPVILVEIKAGVPIDNGSEGLLLCQDGDKLFLQTGEKIAVN